VFERLYIKGLYSVEFQLVESVIKLYADVLTYLSIARHYYDQHPGGGFNSEKHPVDVY